MISQSFAPRFETVSLPYLYDLIFSSLSNYSFSNHINMASNHMAPFYDVALFVISLFRLQSLDLSIIAFRKASVTKFTRFTVIYFFFIGACLFKMSMNVFVKLARVVKSRVTFSLLSKEFK